MKKVIVFGAGLSATYLIHHLEGVSASLSFALTVVDRDLELAKQKCNNPDTTVLDVDINDTKKVTQLLKDSDLVISMLPASLHIVIAKHCLALGTHLATASYLSSEIQALDTEVKNKKLIFLNECGLDPGIDHLSAMHMLDEIRNKGGEITEFESFTGGLVTPESEDNPWRYKFTWNPRNVVLAGSGGAVKFIHNGQYKYIPYQKVFRRTEVIDIEDYGRFEGYANRDSLRYRETYGLDNVKTMYRGTLRRRGFSKAWNCFVQLGATDDSYTLENSEELTYRGFINTFLAYHPTDSVEIKLRQYLGIAQDDVNLWERLESLDLFSNKKVGLKNATPAQVLQKILEEKWTLEPTDRDMVVMWHKVTYRMNGEKRIEQASMVVEGEDQQHTAMAKTVGLPLAYACELIIKNEIETTGCVLPITEEFYKPILQKLESQGISFKTKNYGMV